MKQFAERFPRRCFDVGIAEQHAVTFCAGLAAGGMKPFCAIYSTFLQRGYDQIVHDVAIQSLPVRFAIDRAGLVGQTGRPMRAPSTSPSWPICPVSSSWPPPTRPSWSTWSPPPPPMTSGPIAFRFPRGEGTGVEMPERGQVLEIGKGRMITEGKTVAILSFGTRLAEVMTAAEALSARGITPTVADARFAKPLDRDLILQLARDHDALITIEEGAVGGFGSHVAQLLAEEGVFDTGLKFRSMVLPDEFVDHDAPRAMYDTSALNAEHIEAKVLSVLGIGDLDARRAREIRRGISCSCAQAPPRSSSNHRRRQRKPA